ncbi:hypothetical protein ACU4GD_10545 [Cupriavidus basilensis]
MTPALPIRMSRCRPVARKRSGEIAHAGQISKIQSGRRHIFHAGNPCYELYRDRVPRQ